MAFFPARDTLALSDHRVGLGVIATPVMSLGGSPVTAYNVAFVLSFILSASAAYALCFALTRSRAAAFVGGLVFGFNPFRIEHLAHLELLASYVLPIVLLALHRWAATLRRGWLLLLTAALTVQALTSGYYFFFGCVLLALWLVWFTPRRLPISEYAALGAALLMPLILIAPILVKYRDVHHAMGLSRSLTEIELLSADLIAFVTAPELLKFWNSPAEWRRLEGSLIPGVTAIVLVMMLVCVARRSRPAVTEQRWVRAARIALLLGGIAAMAAALIPLLVGPVAYELGDVRLSISRSYKPVSIAALLLGCWFLTSPSIRDARRRRSTAVFYILATLAMWLLALGPTGRLLGHPVLYKAPYAWLMTIPPFRDGFRAPGRFAMLAVLTLSVAAAVAYWRLFGQRSPRVRLAAVCLVSCGIAVDSWIDPLPLARRPRPLTIPATVPQDAVILALPSGVYEDATAMYRSMFHGRPVVNGLGGYEPPHTGVLRAALDEGRIEILHALTAHRDLAVFVRRDASGASFSRLLASDPAVRPLASTEHHEVFLLPRRPSHPTAPVKPDQVIAIRTLTSNINAHLLPHMTDGDRRTTWFTGPQRGGEHFTADLGEPFGVAGIVLALGASISAFPRAIAVELSLNDDRDWTEVWRGQPAVPSFAAAVADPREIRVPFVFPPKRARYVRVRQFGESAGPWAVAEFRVLRSPRPHTIRESERSSLLRPAT